MTFYETLSILSMLFYLQSVTCLHVDEILTNHRLAHHYGDFIIELSRRYFRNELPLVIAADSMDSCIKVGDKYLNYSDIIMKRINEGMYHTVIAVGCEEKRNNFVAEQFGVFEVARGLVNVVFLVPDNSLLQLQIFWAFRLLTEVSFKINHIERAAVLFTGLGKYEDSLLGLSGIFTVIMNSIKGRDTIMIIPRSDQLNQPTLDVLNWIPEDQEDSCFLNIDTVQTLDTWISKEKGFLQNKYLFPEKKMRNAEKCEVKVGVIDTIPFIATGDANQEKRGGIKKLYGVFYELFNVISQQTNLEFLYYNEHLNEENFSTVAAEYIHYEYEYRGCPHTYPYFSKAITWYVPVHQVPRWQGLVRVFHPLMWLLVTVTFLLGSLTFWLFDKSQADNNLNTTEILMNVLRTHLAIGIIRRFASKPANIFFLLWLFYCLQIYTAYTSELTGFLANPGTYRLVNDLEELEFSNYEKWVVSGLFNSSHQTLGVILEYPKRIEELVNDVYHKWITYPTCDIYDCFDKLVKDKNVAVLADRYSFDLLIEYSTPADETRAVVPVTEVVRRYNIVIGTDLGCFFVKKFNLITRSLISSGIAAKLVKYVSSRFIKPLIIQGDFHSVRPVTLSELQGPFFVLICGHILGLIVFVYEICTFKRLMIFSLYL